MNRTVPILYTIIMQPIQLNLNSFEGTVDKIIDDNGEDIIRTIHNDGTETFYGKTW